MTKNLVKIAAVAAFSFSLFACDSKEEIVRPKAEIKDIDFSNASADYYGDYVEGLANYTITLYNGELDADGYITGEAEVLYLDIYAPESGTADAIPAGTYTVAAGSALADFTFLEGEELSLRDLLQQYIDAGFDVDLSEYSAEELDGPSGEISGSEFYLQTPAGKDEDGEETYDYDDHLITVESGSSVNIAVSGGKYVITANLTLDGKDVTFTYNGDIEIADCTQDDGGDDSGSGEVSDRSNYAMYSFNSFTQGELDYCGSADGYTYWVVYLADANINLDDLSGSGKIVAYELATTATDTKKLASGNYVIGATSGDYVGIAAYTDDNNYIYGTFYAEGDDIPVAATAGNIIVNENNGKYEINATFHDDEYQTSFTSYYGGSLAFYDATASAASLSKTARRHSLPTATRKNTLRK